MPTPAAIFREIHRLRRYVRELEGKADQEPRLRKAQDAKLARQETILKQAQDGLKHLKVEIHQNEVSIKSAQDQIKKYEKQLKEMISNKKEYDALTHEIGTAKATIAKLEDETLELMGQSEEQTAKLPEVEVGLRKAKEEHARFDQDHAQALDRYAQERLRALDELKAQEALLPEDLVAQYNRFVAAKGADAMSSVQNGVCSACYTEVTPQMTSELRRGSFLMCKNCGRILYAET
jgi:predicted  nucleic acid-binding Zn-ribbon protein